MLINFGFVPQRKSQVMPPSHWLKRVSLDQSEFRGRIYEKKTATETRNAACHFDPDGDIDYFEGEKI